MRIINSIWFLFILYNLHIILSPAFDLYHKLYKNVQNFPSTSSCFYGHILLRWQLRQGNFKQTKQLDIWH